MPEVKPQKWYRRRTWTSADQEDFFKRLAYRRYEKERSEKCRVQAVELCQVGTPETLQGALELSDLWLSLWAGELLTSWVQSKKGECLYKLGRIDEAAASFRAALATQRENPLVVSGADLYFGWMVVTHRRDDLYPEVMSILEEFERLDSGATLPNEGYRYAAICAIVADESHQPDLAERWARKALELSAQTYSGFWGHPTLGVLKAIPDAEIHRRLIQLARADGQEMIDRA